MDILRIRNLSVDFRHGLGKFRAVDGVDIKT